MAKYQNEVLLSSVAEAPTMIELFASEYLIGIYAGLTFMSGKLIVCN